MERGAACIASMLASASGSWATSAQQSVSASVSVFSCSQRRRVSASIDSESTASSRPYASAPSRRHQPGAAAHVDDDAARRRCEELVDLGNSASITAARNCCRHPRSTNASHGVRSASASGSPTRRAAHRPGRRRERRRAPRRREQVDTPRSPGTRATCAAGAPPASRRRSARTRRRAAQRRLWSARRFWRAAARQRRRRREARCKEPRTSMVVKTARLTTATGRWRTGPEGAPLSESLTESISLAHRLATPPRRSSPPAAPTPSARRAGARLRRRAGDGRRRAPPSARPTTLHTRRADGRADGGEALLIRSGVDAFAPGDEDAGRSGDGVAAALADGGRLRAPNK